jgi:hypothetical protein
LDESRVYASGECASELGNPSLVGPFNDAGVAIFILCIRNSHLPPAGFGCVPSPQSGSAVIVPGGVVLLPNRMFNMKKRLLHRFTPFVELSRRQRRDLYVRLRSKIERKASIYGEKFTSDLVLDEPGRPRLYKQWFDFYFLGSDGITIWNTFIRTAADEFWSQASSLASVRVMSLLSDEQKEQEYKKPRWEGPFMEDGEKYYLMAEREEQAYACFGGLTSTEYKQKCEREIIENEPPAIYESFKIDRSYEYGIGLKAVVLADEINRDVIEMTIERFRQMGETDWQSEHPVPREALPVETQDTALSKIDRSTGVYNVIER